MKPTGLPRGISRVPDRLVEVVYVAAHPVMAEWLPHCCASHAVCTQTATTRHTSYTSAAGCTHDAQTSDAIRPTT